MGKINFHWRDRDAIVVGAERCSVLCGRIATSHPAIPWCNNETWDFILGGENRDPRLFVATDMDGNFFVPCLNTAMDIVNDDVKMALRVHAQCEVHGFIEPDDRHFIADRIEACLRLGVFRKTINGYDTGWRNVCKSLRANASVCVMSYSVTESFPNGHDSWDFGVEKLREIGDGLRLQEAGWSDFRFGDCRTIIDVYRDAEIILSKTP